MVEGRSARGRVFVTTIADAMSEITAPGTNVSSMILALSSLEQRRRRPVPMITVRLGMEDHGR
jgi:hypothetical protein